MPTIPSTDSTPTTGTGQDIGDNRLAVLAAEIKREYRDAQDAAQRTLTHALAAGERLIEAKALIQHGGWLPWLAEHVGVSTRTAQVYMRLARNKAKIAKNATVADLTIRSAVNSVTTSPDPDRDELAVYLPLPGHIRIGLGDGQKEVWIAPSYWDDGFVFITTLTASEVLGSIKPVAIRAVPMFLDLLEIVPEDMRWLDEPFPAWNGNIILFPGFYGFIDGMDLRDLVHMIKNGRPPPPADDLKFGKARRVSEGGWLYEIYKAEKAQDEMATGATP